LRRELARSVGVPVERLFLMHGATEGNAWVMHYLAGHHRSRAGVCRVRLPEYPMLFDGPRAAGFRVVTDRRPTDLAVLSLPRNPEGVDWTNARLEEWAAGARHLLLDETFREFGHLRSRATLDRHGVWTTGTFTKFYGGDDLRVGYVTVPEAERDGFARFVGLFSDEIAPASVAGALLTLERSAAFHRRVDRVMARNRAALARAFPGGPVPVGPVWFDRFAGIDTQRLARRLVRRSVLVCPGSYFGDPTGVRLCLTRRTFGADLAAYLAGCPPREIGTEAIERGARRTARPGHAGNARAPVGRA
jgi:histidinol-phosphate/aromatic aminotransferase/cobyric acid decarboxylase-like protein